jgi:hypothetical protein
MTLNSIQECKQMVVSNDELESLIIELSRLVNDLEVMNIEIDTNYDDDGLVWGFITYKQQRNKVLKLGEDMIEISIKDRYDEEGNIK